MSTDPLTAINPPVRRLLHIDASPRADKSLSRLLSSEFVQAYRDANPRTEIVYRDLTDGGLPFMSLATHTAMFKAPDDHDTEDRNALLISDQLVDEFLAAETVVIGTPRYNFGPPAVLKAYIDQVFRFGRTFTLNQDGLFGLVGDKPVVFITASGSDFSPDGLFARFDFLESYLRAAFGVILGLKKLHFVSANSLNGPRREAELLTAREQFPMVLAALAGYRRYNH